MTQPRAQCFIIGPIGTVGDIYGAIDAELAERQTGWDDLARSLGVSRQYLTRVLREAKVPLQLATDACKAVGLRIEDMIEPTRFVRMVCELWGLAEGGGGSSGGGGSATSQHLRAMLDETGEQVVMLTRQLSEARAGVADSDQRARAIDAERADAVHRLEQARERCRELEDGVEEQTATLEVALRERTRRCAELETQLAEAHARLLAMNTSRPVQKPQSQHFSF